MVYRYSWIAAAAGIALAFWELSFLLLSSTSGTPWQVAIVMATLLGAGITWTALAYRAHAVVVIGVNLAAFILFVGFIVAPETLWFIFPTADTWDAVLGALRRAFDLIQYGVEPIVPLPGLVSLIALLFWTLGFLLVAGLLNGRPFVAVLTPLIVALQFVIIDRSAKGIAHLAIFVGVVAGSLLAVRLDERDSGSGRLQRVNGTRPPSKRPSPAITVLVAATVVFSLVAVAFVGDRVPRDGFVSWRSPAGFADGYSGDASYNPYTDIKANVISQTNNPLFRANIVGTDPDRVRFKTVTLDVFEADGGRWKTDRVTIFPVTEDPWIADEQVYRGETVEVTASITIDNLHQPWLPAPDTPNAVDAPSGDDLKTMRVRRLDGTLIMRGDQSYRGMEYTVRSEVPRYDGDTIATLARSANGELSPLFATAVANGETLPNSGDSPEPLELPDEDHWLDYDAKSFPPEFDQLALGVVGNVRTNFEKALALEHWFRDSGEFTYNTRVPSENTESDVYAWLTDESNEFRRHGYCEQFATAMGVMARSLGVPSRVVLGFTPGTPIPGTSQVQVLDKNAHSWVEMWIPSYGWMAFDPTPRSGFSAQTANTSLEEALGFSPASYVESIPDIDVADSGSLARAGQEIEGDDRAPIVPPSGAGTTEDGGVFNLPNWLPILAVLTILFLGFLVIPPVLYFARRRRATRRLAKGDVTAAWDDIVSRLSDLREPVDPSDTPLELATGIDDAFVPLARTYGRSVYGDKDTAVGIIDTATQDHQRAERRMVERYTFGERVRAIYRPTWMIARYRSLRGRLSRRR
jgi:transglutaminase-like putative cysteine protease/nitrate reductase NapE component